MAPYDKRDAIGNLINAVQIAGQNTPNDTSDDVWKLACLRKLDGSLDVESLAAFTRTSVPTASNPAITWDWYARPTGSLPNSSSQALAFTANAQGFLSPAFTWEFSGGSIVGTNAVPAQQNYYIAYRDAYNPGDVAGVKLGKITDLALQPTTTTVSVVDSDPSRPSTPLKNSYTVNWHLPVENDTLILSKKGWTDVDAMTTGIIGHQDSTQQENGSLEVLVDPSPWKTALALNGTDWFVVGTVGTGVIGAATFAVEAGAAGTAAIISKALPATSTALAVGGASWAFTSTPTASEKQTIVNDAAQWGQAVDDTLEASLPQDQKPQNSTAQVRIDPPSALNGYTTTQLKDRNWGTNPLWKSFAMFPRIRRNYSVSIYKGDGYDEHGYCGEAKTQTEIPVGSPQLYGQYELQITGTSQF